MELYFKSNKLTCDIPSQIPARKKDYFSRMLMLKEIHSLFWTQGLHYWSSNNWKALAGKQYGIRPLEYVNAVQTVTLVNIRLRVALVNVPRLGMGGI